MAIDYSARRQISRNRPKRRPIKLFVVFMLAGISVAYGFGVVTGWLFFRERSASDRKPDAVVTASSKAKQEPSREAPDRNGPPQETTESHGQVPMTFFKTLPSGGKGVIGSGINFGQEVGHPQAGSVAPPTPAAASKPGQPPLTEGKPDSAQPAKTKIVPDATSQAGGERTLERKTAAASEHSSQPEKKGTWSVQVASYQERTEAEESAAALRRKGLSPRIVESKIAGKGVWYRVRVGTGMERDMAVKLANGLGKNAIAVME